MLANIGDFAAYRLLDIFWLGKWSDGGSIGGLYGEAGGIYLSYLLIMYAVRYRYAEVWVTAEEGIY